ncbi:MAG: rod shape-determining protein [Patescibacteria group bacterium]|uniref:Cell shape-determining protein MreB n=1 Tax=candidate division WWE3 bacterium TaxID=2053526 RepID=A0A955J2Y7_UNCKA|nr:rod shape-determining protein [candidate division WWE3 bacterium]
MFSRKIAIDLGTVNSLVYVMGEGVVLSEPTVVALSEEDDKILAIGIAARDMLGKTPQNIVSVKPVKYGVIADYLTTESLLRYFINKVVGRTRFIKPDVLLSVPAGATSVESRAVLDAVYAAGAKNAYLMPEPLAAAIGTGLPIAEPSGNMVVNIGGGTSEIAIVSLYGIVAHGSVKIAGNNLDESIIQYVKREYNLIIGDMTAERVKIRIGSAFPVDNDMSLEVKGRDSITGFPRTITLTTNEVVKCIRSNLNQIALGIKDVLEKTPPELSSDIIDKGIVLCGGTALLKNLDKYLTDYVGVPVHVADDPLQCVVKGLGIALENLNLFKKSLK